MFLQPFEPAQLVIEFRARCRIAVRHVETSDDQAIDLRFDIAAVRVVGIARQAAADQRRLAGALPLLLGRMRDLPDFAAIRFNRCRGENAKIHDEHLGATEAYVDWLVEAFGAVVRTIRF